MGSDGGGKSPLVTDDVIDLRREGVSLTAEERALVHAIYVQEVIHVPEIGRSLGWSDDGVRRLLKVLANKLASIDRPPVERTPPLGIRRVKPASRPLRSQLHAEPPSRG